MKQSIQPQSEDKFLERADSKRQLQLGRRAAVPLLGVRRPGGALVRGGQAPLPFATFNVERSRNRTVWTKAAPGRRTPRSCLMRSILLILTVIVLLEFAGVFAERYLFGL